MINVEVSVDSKSTLIKIEEPENPTAKEINELVESEVKKWLMSIARISISSNVSRDTERSAAK